jgi:hypothetical protein
MALQRQSRRAWGAHTIPSDETRRRGGRCPVWRALLPGSLTREGIVLDRHIREGRFQRTLSLVAGLSSVLSGIEVLTEHYRGSYCQRIMYSPIILSRRCSWRRYGARSAHAARTVLPVVSLITVVDGVTSLIHDMSWRVYTKMGTVPLAIDTWPRRKIGGMPTPRQSWLME